MPYKNDAVKELTEKFMEIDDVFVGVKQKQICYEVRIFKSNDGLNSSSVKTRFIHRGSLRASIGALPIDEYVVSVKYDDKRSACMDMMVELAVKLHDEGKPSMVEMNYDDIPDAIVQEHRIEKEVSDTISRIHREKLGILIATE